MRALCKDPAKRYQTAAEMAADLRKSISHPEGGFVTYPKDIDVLKQEKEEREREDEHGWIRGGAAGNSGTGRILAQGWAEGDGGGRGQC